MYIHNKRCHFDRYFLFCMHDVIWLYIKFVTILRTTFWIGSGLLYSYTGMDESILFSNYCHLQSFGAHWDVIVTILGKTGNYRCNNIITKIILLLTLDLIFNFWKIYISDNNRKLLDNVYLRLLNSHPFCFLHFHIHNFVFWELGCKRNISMQLFLRFKIDNLRHIRVQEDGEPGNGVSCKRIQCKFLLKIMVTIKFPSNLMVKVVKKSKFDESWPKKIQVHMTYVNASEKQAFDTYM